MTTRPIKLKAHLTVREKIAKLLRPKQPFKHKGVVEGPPLTEILNRNRNRRK